MSTFIDAVRAPYDFGILGDVWASTDGVELRFESRELPLSPVAARNFAALLVRAADEVERMRRTRLLEPVEEQASTESLRRLQALQEKRRRIEAKIDELTKEAWVRDTDKDRR